MKTMSKQILAAATLCLVVLSGAFSGCGNAIPADDDSGNSSNTNSDGTMANAKYGQAGFGLQCPYAYVQEPTPVGIDLSECPNTKIKLTTPLVPILLSADCRNKLLTARTGDRTVDDTFEAMPDGSFFLEMQAGYAELDNGCKVPLVADMAGMMTCGSLTNQNYDQVDVAVDASWKTAPPSSTATSLPGAPAESTCAIPPGCMLHASILLHQCK